MTYHHAILISYKGFGLHGWAKQKQDNLLTVQGCIEASLSVIFNEPIHIYGAGRTDAGVHALGQVAHFTSTNSRSNKSIKIGGNRYISKLFPKCYIKILSACSVSDEFHSRFSAVERAYRYILYYNKTPSLFLHGLALNIKKKLDISLMQQGGDLFLGQHDFSMFTTKQNNDAMNHVRTIDFVRIYQTKLLDGAQKITIDIRAKSFLHHQIRNIVASLVDIATHKISLTSLQSLIANEEKSQSLKPSMVSSEGLYLLAVFYRPGQVTWFNTDN